MTRRIVPWAQLVVGVVTAGAGLVLLAEGVARSGPLGFLGWRTLVVGIVGALLARPGARAWRDAIAISAALAAGLGLFGIATTTGDVARVGLVAVTVALCAAPLAHAATVRRLPGTGAVVGAALGLGAIALLGTSGGTGVDLALSVASGLSFAGAAVLTDRAITQRPVAGVVTAALTAAGALLVVAGGILGEGWLPTTGTIGLIVVTGLGSGVAAMLARWRAAEVLGVRTARLGMVAEAPAVVATAVLVGAAAPSPDLWAALAVGVVAAAVSGRDGPVAAAEAFSGGR